MGYVCKFCLDEVSDYYEMVEHLMTHSTVKQDYLDSEYFELTLEEYESTVLDYFEEGEGGELVCAKCFATVADDWYSMVEHVKNRHGKDFFEYVYYWFGDPNFEKFVEENFYDYAYETRG